MQVVTPTSSGAGERPAPSSDSQRELLNQAQNWPGWRLNAFRFAAIISIIAGVRMLPLMSSYVPAGPAREAIDAVLASASRLEYQAVMRTGGFLINTALDREPLPGPQLVIRYSSDAAVGSFCYAIGILTIASAVTLAWAVVDRRRVSYHRAYAWHRVYVRWLTALVMMIYALVKLIPTQFGVITPGTALRSFGDFRRFDVLWNFMAASTGYTMFTGAVELTGVLLLVFRRTTVIGAIILGAALVNIFALDLAYDIRGAAHIAMLLLTLCAVILAPYLPAFMRLFVWRSSGVLPEEPVAVRWKYGPTLTIAVLALLILVRVADGVNLRRTHVERRHAFTGLFDVQGFAVGSGATASEGTAWRRVADDDRYAPGTALIIQYSDGTSRRYMTTDDPASKTLTLRAPQSPSTATLRYEVTSDGSISVSGTLDDRPVTMRLRRIERENWPPLLRR